MNYFIQPLRIALVDGVLAHDTDHGSCISGWIAPASKAIQLALPTPPTRALSAQWSVARLRAGAPRWPVASEACPGRTGPEPFAWRVYQALSQQAQQGLSCRACRRNCRCVRASHETQQQKVELSPFLVGSFRSSRRGWRRSRFTRQSPVPGKG